MDDNENVIDKIQLSSFTSHPVTISESSLVQSSNLKLQSNIPLQNGQFVLSGVDGNVHNDRTSILINNQSNNQFSHQATPLSSLSTSGTSESTNLNDSIITLPVTMPGSKPGEAQQTVHIQVMNPNATKFQMGQIPITSLQSFPTNGTTVLTVAYNPTEGKFISNGLPEGMTVVAALQPHDLQMLAQAQQHLNIQQQFIHHNNQDQSLVIQNVANEPLEEIKHEVHIDEINVKQEPSEWDSSVSQNPSEYNDFLQSHSFSLNSFLKFPGNIKQEIDTSTNHYQDLEQPSEQLQVINQKILSEEDSKELENDLKSKRKRRPKKKTPKIKQPKPGQVLIATAIDGTTLFCCPECQMAYPEKENLEQHLTEHKIERRYICDICGAGLKRKEHLERHKSGHNPDRPYICSVCLKGFKRKEHLNLHFVIHSGEKTEVCSECGKGFYRKDHLRKHANSHAAKRLKEEMNSKASGCPIPISIMASSTDVKINNFDKTSKDNILAKNIAFTRNSDILRSNHIHSIIDDNNSCVQITNTQAAISLSTVYVPTSDNTTLPVQIQIPQIITTCSSDGTTSTMIMPDSMESQNLVLTT
ncbi:hypothetical protein ACFFRR_001084 [Megaselia abdita]